MSSLKGKKNTANPISGIDFIPEKSPYYREPSGFINLAGGNMRISLPGNIKGERGPFLLIHEDR
jgi:hypothetical protein